MEEETVNEGPSYYIDLKGGGGRRRSVSVMIAGRKCYEHQLPNLDQPAQDSDPQDHISDIVEHCSDTADYLLHDTPLKEAIFRVLLAGGNQPMNPREIAEILTSRWAMSPYPRDLSPRVIGRLLHNGHSYSIVAIPEPEPEPELEPPPADIADPSQAESGPGSVPDILGPQGEASEIASLDPVEPVAEHGEQQGGNEEQPIEGSMERG